MTSKHLALYTTVYKGVEPYLAGWYESVLRQSDINFDLYIGVDNLGVEQITAAIGREPRATIISAMDGASRAGIRNTAFAQLVNEYDAVVLVDSDDLLQPSRIAAARRALKTHDMVGCALRVVDERGQDLGLDFGPAREVDYDTFLPHHNIFGLSNTAYRTTTLRRCLPVPDDCVLIDWWLATRAWATSAAITFDHQPHMKYRRYPENTAPLLPPFTSTSVLRATQLVLDHYRFVLGTEQWEGSKRLQTILEKAHDLAREFEQGINRNEEMLARYVEALNNLKPEYVWWWCVANPKLKEIWKS